METEDSKRYEFHKYYTNEIWGMSNGYELCLDRRNPWNRWMCKNDFGLFENKKFNLKKFLTLQK